jgi:peptide/nickel transport system substrate-binding protein
MRSFGMSLLASAILATAAQAAELRVGNATLPAGLGNPLIEAAHSSNFAYTTVFDFLTYGTRQGPQPGIAVSWKNTSPTTWEMKIRPGVKFHNGNTVSANDIGELINWMNTTDGKVKSNNVLRNMANVVGARVIDNDTLEVQSKTPDPMVPALLATFKVMDMRQFKEVGWENLGKNPIGTGPYRATSWTAQKVDLLPFKEGWRPGKIDKITLNALPEVASRIQAFQSDQIDIALEIITDAKERVEAASGTMHVSSAPQVINLMIFQNKPSPVADVRVRQALNYAVDKEKYVSTIMRGLVKPASQPAASTVNGFDPDIKPYPYDPAKARALLSAAGHGSGLTLQAEVVTTSADRRDLYQAVALDLQKVGVNVVMREITLADLLQKVRDTSKFGEVTLWGMNFGSEPTMDVMRSLNALHSCQADTKWICFPEIEPTIKAANEEFDVAKRLEHLKRINRFYHENAPAIFLYEEVQVDAVKRRVQNYRPENRYIFWHDITVQG